MILVIALFRGNAIEWMPGARSTARTAQYPPFERKEKSPGEFSGLTGEMAW